MFYMWGVSQRKYNGVGVAVGRKKSPLWGKTRFCMWGVPRRIWRCVFFTAVRKKKTLTGSHRTRKTMFCNFLDYRTLLSSFLLFFLKSRVRDVCELTPWMYLGICVSMYHVQPVHRKCDTPTDVSLISRFTTLHHRDTSEQEAWSCRWHMCMSCGCVCVEPSYWFICVLMVLCLSETQCPH